MNECDQDSTANQVTQVESEHKYGPKAQVLPVYSLPRPQHIYIPTFSSLLTFSFQSCVPGNGGCFCRTAIVTTQMWKLTLKGLL